MSNTELWDVLGKTDPAHTKRFSRAGGFKGTATKPIWVYRRLTEQFGPVGQGWGHGKPDFTVTPGADGEVLVYCTVCCWHTNRENTFYGVGGDKVIVKDKNGLRSDDEAFKKAFTDGVMNAFKSVGVAADVHMGLFDDDKYVGQMEREFAPAPVERKAPDPAAKISDKTRHALQDLIITSGGDVSTFCRENQLTSLADLTNARAAELAAPLKEKKKELA